jgi:protein-L-isoaspartate O-methyltransferase
MGAVSFSLDTQLVQTLQSRLPLTVLLETGTYQGETLAANLERFEQLISIELAPELFHAARQRFSASAKVKICQGDSPRHLQRLQSMLRPLGVLYWLDAHWCASSQ